MRSLIFGSLALTLSLFAPPAAADPLVTTGETDSGEPSFFVVIVDPLDGAVLAGAPDVVVPVVMEFEAFDGGFDVSLSVDDVYVNNCNGQISPCTLEVTLTPGPHTLMASTFGDNHSITVTVTDNSTETTDTGSDTSSSGSDTDATGNATDTGEATGATSSATDSGATSGASGGTEATGSTDATGSTGNVDGASGGDSSGDKGCACSTRGGAPDILGLALAALLAPWRRRRTR